MDCDIVFHLAGVVGMRLTHEWQSTVTKSRTWAVRTFLVSLAAALVFCSLPLLSMGFGQVKSAGKATIFPSKVPWKLMVVIGVMRAANSR